ncbi:MAG TPA: hypothetical protein VGD64_16480 [Acidisarcina sp.]
MSITRVLAEKNSRETLSGNVVVWLTPIHKSGTSFAPAPRKTYTLAQKDKRFYPHVLVVPSGSNVDFPNFDPFFHNVFSLFNGKRFDLGLYEPNTDRSVLFDREGVSYIFCNIHPEMGAVIITVNTPYYGVSSRDGTIIIRNVQPGSYRMSVWAENVTTDNLSALGRVVDIGPQSKDLGTLHLQATADTMSHHMNKFGELYPPQPKGPY